MLGSRVLRPAGLLHRLAWLLVGVWGLMAGGCAPLGSSGVAASGFINPAIAVAYLPLTGPPGALFKGHGAAVVVAPGVAATNAHNADFVDAAAVLGRSTQYDLLYFATPHRQVPPAGTPRIGESVIAYGQGTDGSLRMATGVVRRLDVPVVPRCPLCRMQYAFAFEAQAGQGFSGGPVVDATDGRLIGIVFGFLDHGPEDRRTMYAYPMERVLAELPASRATAGRGIPPVDAGMGRPGASAKVRLTDAHGEGRPTPLDRAAPPPAIGGPPR